MSVLKAPLRASQLLYRKRPTNTILTQMPNG